MTLFSASDDDISTGVHIIICRDPKKKYCQIYCKQWAAQVPHGFLRHQIKRDQYGFGFNKNSGVLLLYFFFFDCSWGIESDL